MSIPVPAVCAPIHDEVKQLNARIDDLTVEIELLQAELQNVPPSVKPFIIKMIKQTKAIRAGVKAERDAKQKELRECQRENLPDLRPRTVTIEVDHAERTICVAGIIRNDGGADASGPFKVAIGITVVKAGVTISSEEIFHIPQSVDIAANGGEYVTECSRRELIYRDEDAGAVYTLEVLVDVDFILPEFDKGNNHFKATWWTISPSAAKETTPLRIDSECNRSE